MIYGQSCSYGKRMGLQGFLALSGRLQLIKSIYWLYSKLTFWSSLFILPKCMIIKAGRSNNLDLPLDGGVTLIKERPRSLINLDQCLHLFLRGQLGLLRIIAITHANRES
jgi:hypothetical protein